MARVGGNGTVSEQRPATGTSSISVQHPDMESGIDSREERRLMRQRGAGNRAFNNIDFGFAFATPIQTSARKLRPRSRTPSIAAHTPAERINSVRQINPLTTRSARTPQVSAIVLQEPELRLSSQTQRKRRRLSDISNISRTTSQGLPAVYEDGDAEVPEESQFGSTKQAPADSHEQRYQNARGNIPSSPLFFPDPPRESFDVNKENEPSRNIVKKRKRKSIGQQSLFKKKKRPSESTVESSRVTPATEEGTEQEQPGIDNENSSPTANIVASPNLIPNELSRIRSLSRDSGQVALPDDSKASNRRKKRRSITGVKKKRRSNDAVTHQTKNITPAAESQQDEDHGNAIQDEQHSVSDSTFRRATGYNDEVLRSPSVPQNEPIQTPRATSQHEEDADETYLPEEATPEPTPAPKRARTKRAGRDRSRSERRASRGVANGRHSKYPILTHRMTNVSALPTIVEDVALALSHHDDDDEEIDELSGNAPAIMTKLAPNAVDVLAQACRETIDASIARPKNLASADRNRQTTALQTFRSNLDIRLFDLSQSLDQRLHLEARLRKQRREKAELQARWLEVRKQRDVVALRMDAARRQHWENEHMSRQAWQVSQSAHRLETAMSRAEGQPEQNSRAALLEFSLRQLSQEVSSKDGAGVLNVLKNFNAQLERAARVSS